MGKIHSHNQEGNQQEMLSQLRVPFIVKVTAALLIAGLFPLWFVSTSDLERSSRQVHLSAEALLTSALNLKRKSVESYFDATVRAMQTVAASPATLDALRRLDNAVEQLHAAPTVNLDNAAMQARFDAQRDATEDASATAAQVWINDLDERARLLQQLFIFGNPATIGSKQALANPGDGSLYSTLHAQFHPALNATLDRYGFYDFFLIEPANGRIVYSTFKETDFGTSLRSGPYRDTEFAKSVVEIIEGNTARDYTFVDFAPYAPSNGAAAAFLLLPIRDEGALAGVFAAQLPSDFADDVLGLTTGRYGSEDAYIFSGDMGLRSIPLLSREAEVGMLFDTPLVRSINASGGTDTRFFEGISHHGDPVFAASAPLSLSGLDWRVVTEISKDEVLADAIKGRQEAQRNMLILAAVIFFAGLLLARLLIRPIRILGSEVQGQAKQVVEALSHAAEQARSAAVAMASTAEETSRQSKAAKDSACETAASVDAVAQASEELSSSVAEIVQGIGRTAQLVDSASGQADAASRILAELERVAGRITGIVGLIKEVTNRTNLLALNAAVEAAHAGDAGRGFAVVAAEIRRLAVNTAESTAQIGEEIQNVVAAVARNSTAIHSISASISEVNAQAGTISAAAQQQGTVTTSIASRMSSTATRMNEVDSGISEVQKASQLASTAANEVMSLMQHVDDAALRMTDTMSEFVRRIRSI
ncbi:methyl-accepting chemotaxis protein [Roseovarius mucosus]|uniref:methyl-accepting chemotaxis protein n=1 Tax=Roseovarius mucosus TaxID=215743 RepID=UPI001C5EA46A|nr:methyl-accepting chemotaxis protein [Roseovarius mucosus]MBW4974974.1 methyl-accepting chemotaxis protein [Roseovarius mucosus]